MRRAHERDAATRGKFFFRSRVDSSPGEEEEDGDSNQTKRVKQIHEYSPCDFDPQSGLEEMTVLEILGGKVSASVILFHFFLHFFSFLFFHSRRASFKSGEQHTMPLPCPISLDICLSHRGVAAITARGGSAGSRVQDTTCTVRCVLSSRRIQPLRGRLFLPPNVLNLCRCCLSSLHLYYLLHAAFVAKGDFPGLIPLVHAYLEYIDADPSTIERVDT